MQQKPNQNQETIKPFKPNYNESNTFLERLDATRSWEQKTEQQKQVLLQQQEQQYQRGKLIEKIQSLEKQLTYSKSTLSKVFKKKKEALEHLESLRMNLANMDSRIKEQNDALEKKSQIMPENTMDDEKQKRMDYIKQQQSTKHSKGRGKGPKL